MRPAAPRWADRLTLPDEGLTDLPINHPSLQRSGCLGITVKEMEQDGSNEPVGGEFSRSGTI